MKLKYIVYLCICAIQFINASDIPSADKTSDIDASNILVGIKRHIIDKKTKNKKIRNNTPPTHTTVIAMPSDDALRHRFNNKNYHAFLKDTKILAQLKNTEPTPATIYKLVEEICNKFYPHKDYNTFLTRIHHKDQIIRIILRDHPDIITELANHGKILNNAPASTKKP